MLDIHSTIWTRNLENFSLSLKYKEFTWLKNVMYVCLAIELQMASGMEIMMVVHEAEEGSDLTELRV